jgi:hypothetical protein
MSTKSNDPHVALTAGGQWLALGSDGYVRVRLSSFLQVPLQHLLSGLDDDLMNAAPQAAQISVISGHTEWLSRTKPALTLGWDWQLQGVDGRASCQRTGLPRSNIMLIGEFNEDLGAERTAILLASAVDALPWQEPALAAIQQKYS